MAKKTIRTYAQFETALERADELECLADDGLITPEQQAEWDALDEAILDYEDRQEAKTGFRI